MASSASQNPRVALIILDGFGIGPDSPHNAIMRANMPFYRSLWASYPHSQLVTHGEAVGLPPKVMGNSEVGHMTLGSGRVIYQDLMRINRDIESKEFFKNPVLLDCIRAAQKNGKRVHLMGLLSDGGVHSHISHLKALIQLCHQEGQKKVSVHAFMDGRDTAPDSGVKYLQDLRQESGFELATLMGRYYAMDRDQRWERTDLAFDAMCGQGEVTETDPLQVLEKNYHDKIFDEFIKPVILNQKACYSEGDSLIFFNFRGDRARQISEKFLKTYPKISFCGMAVYDEQLSLPAAYTKEQPQMVLGEVLQVRGLKQFRVAETEKYAHVTFFFNGGREEPFRGEDRILIPSNKEVATYDLAPEMSAQAIADQASQKIASQAYDFVLMNFANPDMVGHTGNFEAAVQALGIVDRCLEQVISTAQKSGTHVIVTADHGNAEEMQDCNGKPHTQHTLNPVPALWIAPGTAIAPKKDRVALQDGILADVMPSCCELLNIPIPDQVCGKSLLPRSGV